MRTFPPKPILHRQASYWADPKAYRAPRVHLTLGERLVLFFRMNGEALTFWFAMFSIALLVGVVAGAFVGAIR